MSPFSRPKIMHQEATQCRITTTSSVDMTTTSSVGKTTITSSVDYVRIRIFKLQVLIDNYLSLYLMACPIALNLW